MNHRTAGSDALFAAACRRFPGGVNSPVRAFGGVDGTPRFIAKGDGAWITDVDGNRYLDFVMSWGALILGHADAGVVAAISAQAALGTTFGAPTALETALGDEIAAAMPSIEMLRFVSSGTEAVMSALRLARAATGRRQVIKFSGNYHGHADGLLVQAGSGVATLGLPDSPGVTAGAAGDTLVAQYNDLESVERIASHADSLAAIIVEPVAGNMGLVLPAPGFLAGLRRIADRTGSLLIFDEVMTGFRVARGGAQALYRVRPDLTTLGKVIGGGLPAAAYGGSRELMRSIAPSGPVYQAGTLSGNPLAMAAGLATLRRIAEPGVHENLATMSARLMTGLRDAAADAGVALQAAAVGGMWGFSFSSLPIKSYEDARRHVDAKLYAEFFHALLERGVYLAPSAFEAGFVSTAHDARIVDRAVDIMREALISVGPRRTSAR